MAKIKLEGFEKRGNSSELIVLIHAYMSSPKKLHSVRKIIASEFKNADLYTPNVKSSWSSTETPVQITEKLLNNIDQICIERQEQSSSTYEKIIFVGHSLGALIARKLYVCACGELSPGSFEKEISEKKPRQWAKNVERLVLLAGMNRGWRISHHLSLKNAVIWSIASFFGNILTLVRGVPPLIFSIRKGAPFITQLRLQWIHMRNNVKENKIGDALTIQLLGSIDDRVSPEDNIDLISGRDFIYLDMPYSGHSNVIEMDEKSPVPNSNSLNKNENSTIGGVRASIFREALKNNKDQLVEKSMLPADLPPEKGRVNVTDVVFVIHGIRDLGYWTHKVARRVIELGKHNDSSHIVLATKTPSYGYFPILSFLLPSKRREKVEWLMDQYAETLALYPKAEFSFVGHSNGTYLLSRALRDYPACKFKHVLLAGSVIKTQYNWKSAIANGQVKKVLNYIATADWVVAFFPRAIQMLRVQDLGSAGHDGFVSKKNEVEQVRYIHGGHGAALNEANWDAIANFILTGNSQEPPPNLKRKKQALIVKIPGLVAPLLWLIIGVLIFLTFQYIWCLNIQEWARTLLCVGFGGILLKIATKI